MNLAGVRTLFELEERLGKRILEHLYDEGTREQADAQDAAAGTPGGATSGRTAARSTTGSTGTGTDDGSEPT